MPALTRALGALAALAGMVAFACHFAVPVDVGGGSITLSEATATYRDVGVGGQVLLLAALGLAVALRPALGARALAVGGTGLPWLAGSVDQLWADGVSAVVRVFAAAVLVAMVVVAVAVVVGAREVRWAEGGVLLGDGLAVLVAGAVLWGLLGVNWYRLRDLTSNLTTPSRFGSLLDTGTGGGRLAWVALGLAVAALAVAVSGGGWGRRLTGTVVAGVGLFEAVRRVFLSGDRLIPPADRQAAAGFDLSGEPVLGLLVLPLVAMAAGAWLLTTEGERAPVLDEPEPEWEADPA